MSHTIVSMVCRKLGVFWRNHVNGCNDNTRKLLIEAANSFESVRSDRVIQLHSPGNHFNFNDGAEVRRCDEFLGTTKSMRLPDWQHQTSCSTQDNLAGTTY